MTNDGRMSLWVALLVLAGLGLLIAGVSIAPAHSLSTWLMGGAWFATSWALGAYRKGALKLLARKKDRP